MHSQLLETKGNILVIDDTPENLHLLAAMLTKQGYKVRSVTKGAAGLRGATAAPPDLILLDINMPEMNGYEVCQSLKAGDRTSDIPVIFIRLRRKAEGRGQRAEGINYVFDSAFWLEPTGYKTPPSTRWIQSVGV